MLKRNAKLQFMAILHGLDQRLRSSTLWDGNFDALMDAVDEAKQARAQLFQPLHVSLVRDWIEDQDPLHPCHRASCSMFSSFDSLVDVDVLVAHDQDQHDRNVRALAFLATHVCVKTFVQSFHDVHSLILDEESGSFFAVMYNFSSEPLEP
jgi:hypothetical protein